ncbi:MAG: hypothetical protein EPN93_04775 [Spirochaetes bacterium]|nr:MAG: hypothetical protein EPN93_04775 [Spirochaetota bacterium]
MRKNPVPVGVRGLVDILERYLPAAGKLNYALKILGHPGVGKSAIVKQVAQRMNMLFIDTRLAFKENVDLGGYPVPDQAARRMVYFRPKFIPPEEVPAGFDGIVWFLDESNRAHPTVIQTLFQIITEHMCGEHALPGSTAIVLAGNLGEGDSTTITEFDDAALDGRLAVFQLRPRAEEWLAWAREEGLHPSVVRYITLFPDRLWDEANINPNPRGWHQVSLALTHSYGLPGESDLATHLVDEPDGTLAGVIESLISSIASRDFILQVTAPREVSSADILEGDSGRLAALARGEIPAEDLLWAASGAVSTLREMAVAQGGEPDHASLKTLSNVLLFLGSARADVRMSFFYLLIRDCGLFTQVPAAIKLIPDEETRAAILKRFGAVLDDGGTS